jgi:hydrogenase expression/formation protein HypE
LPVAGGRLAFTTDSYVITADLLSRRRHRRAGGERHGERPGRGGARPLWLSLAFILEEGLALSELERVVASVGRAAERAGVTVVTGDTKVVGRGSGDKIFINTSGIGMVADGVTLGSAQVRAGDVILVSGTIGDHGMAILSARERLGLEGDLASDTAPLHQLCAAALAAFPGVHAMRDPTRGGVAATLVEIATRRKLGVEVDERAVPVKDVVRGACELLGLDPLLVANEGKLVVFVPEEGADRVLEAMRAHALGRQSARIGRVVAEHPGFVRLVTPIGGERISIFPSASRSRGSAERVISEPAVPVGEAVAARRRDPEDLCARVHLAEVGDESLHVEAQVRQEVHLVERGPQSAARNMCGYLSGLSSPSVVEAMTTRAPLAEIEQRRADQVAHVLHERGGAERRGQLAAALGPSIRASRWQPGPGVDLHDPRSGSRMRSASRRVS